MQTAAAISWMSLYCNTANVAVRKARIVRRSGNKWVGVESFLYLKF